MGSFVRTNDRLGLGLNQREFHGKRSSTAVVIPIQTGLAKRVREAASNADRREMVEMLRTLRSELRCIDQAIAGIERLAVRRLPKGDGGQVNKPRLGVCGQ